MASMIAKPNRFELHLTRCATGGWSGVHDNNPRRLFELEAFEAWKGMKREMGPTPP
jgi:hypothetical protein